MKNNLWKQFSRDYDCKVFSLTKVPQRREQILERLKPGKILNVGCGSTSYLNRDIIHQGNHVVATDFCQAMLDVAQEDFMHPDLEYILADSKQLPFEDFSFDSVVSVNSILPPERKEVYQMGNEIYRVLKKGGVFVSFLCSYDNIKRAKDNLGLDIKLDNEQMRVMDTTGWQCFHTPNLIRKLVERSGFFKYSFKKVFLETKQEIDELKRLYDVDTSKSLIYEYLLVAHK
jgi:ubiquinone/menaquinone biosynthesis C-methylase UbiE